ncbi:MAG: hypothetical protein ABIA63_05240, partial [bacterium]
PGFSKDTIGHFNRILHDTAWYEDKLPEPGEGQKINLDLFVMSLCPYGIRAEKVILPVIAEWNKNVNFRFYFIMHKRGAKKKKVASSETRDEDGQERCNTSSGEDGNEKYVALHGLEEVEENIRQMLFFHFFGNRAFPYILCRGENQEQDWHDCAEKSGFNHKEIKKVHDLQDSRLADSLAEVSIMEHNKLSVPGSPTLYADGVEIDKRISAYLMESIFCRGKKRSGLCSDFPECGSDMDCMRMGREGICENLGKLNAKCSFENIMPFNVKIINNRYNITSNTGNIIEMVLRKFPGAGIVNVDISSNEGKELIKKYDLEFYPSFIFPEQVKKSSKFKKIKHTFNRVEHGYLIKPGVVKTFRFIKPVEIKGKLDFFMTAQAPVAIQTLRKMELFLEKNRENIDFKFHIFAEPIKEPGDKSGWKSFFNSPYGNSEINEGARLLCIQSLFPEKVCSYALCRGFDVQKRYNKKIPEPDNEWESCASQLEINLKQVKKCTEGEQGEQLFLNCVEFSKRMHGDHNVVFLVNNNWRIQGFNTPIWEIIKTELLKD